VTGAILFPGLADALTFLRLRLPRPVTEEEIFGQLLLDAAALAWVLGSVPEKNDEYRDSRIASG
jgi:hypothetical protein